MSRRYTDEEICTATKESVSWIGLARRLVGGGARTGHATHFAKRARAAGCDTSHFTGQGWSRGKLFQKQPIERYLVLNGPFITSHALKRRLFEEGIKDKCCETCGRVEWLGQPIPLELHHKNGNHKDNRRENLEIDCPNCHAIETRRIQQFTHRGGIEDSVGLDPAAKSVSVQIVPVGLS